MNNTHLIQGVQTPPTHAQAPISQRPGQLHGHTVTLSEEAISEKDQETIDAASLALAEIAEKLSKTGLSEAQIRTRLMSSKNVTLNSESHKKMYMMLSDSISKYGLKLVSSTNTLIELNNYTEDVFQSEDEATNIVKKILYASYDRGEISKLDNSLLSKEEFNEFIINFESDFRIMYQSTFGRTEQQTRPKETEEKSTPTHNESFEERNVDLRRDEGNIQEPIEEQDEFIGLAAMDQFRADMAEAAEIKQKEEALIQKEEDRIAVRHEEIQRRAVNEDIQNRIILSDELQKSEPTVSKTVQAIVTGRGHKQGLLQKILNFFRKKREI